MQKAEYNVLEIQKRTERKGSKEQPHFHPHSNHLKGLTGGVCVGQLPAKASSPSMPMSSTSKHMQVNPPDPTETAQPQPLNVPLQRHFYCLYNVCLPNKLLCSLRTETGYCFTMQITYNLAYRFFVYLQTFH